MTPEEVTAKIDEIQTDLNQRINNVLVTQDPRCQHLIGQLQAFNAMLAEPKKEPSPNKR